MSLDRTRVLAIIFSLLATALMAALIFGGQLFFHQVVVKVLAKINWAQLFWIGAAIFYLVYAIPMWHNAIPSMSVRENWGPPKAAALTLAALIFMPASTVLERTFAFLKMMVSVFTAPLHDELRAIINRAIGLWISIWVSIYVVLVVANLTPTHGHGCRWIFPRILSCLLTDRESLAAGLVGAGGTVFAGWLAWVAVQRQLEKSRVVKNEEVPERPPEGSEVPV